MNAIRSEEKPRGWWRRGWFHYSVSEHCLIRAAMNSDEKARNSAILELRKRPGDAFSKHHLLDWAYLTVGHKKNQSARAARVAIIIIVTTIFLLGGILAGYRWQRNLIQSFSPWWMLPLLLHLLWSSAVFTYYTITLFSKESGEWVKDTLRSVFRPIRPLTGLIRQWFTRIRHWARNKPKSYLADVINGISRFLRGLHHFKLLDSPALMRLGWVHFKLNKNLRWFALWFGALVGLAVIAYDAPPDEDYRWRPDTVEHQDQFMTVIQVALPPAQRIDENVLRWSNPNWRENLMMPENPNAEWRRLFRSLFWYYGVIPRLLIFVPILGLYMKARRALWAELDNEPYASVIKEIDESDIEASKGKETDSWRRKETPTRKRLPTAPKPPSPPLPTERVMIAKYNVDLGEEDARTMLPAPDHRESADYYGPFLGASANNAFLRKIREVAPSEVYLYVDFAFSNDGDFASLAQAIVQAGVRLHVLLLNKAFFIENRGVQASEKRQELWREWVPEAIVEVIQ